MKASIFRKLSDLPHPIKQRQLHIIPGREVGLKPLSGVLSATPQERHDLAELLAELNRWQQFVTSVRQNLHG